MITKVLMMWPSMIFEVLHYFMKNLRLHNISNDTYRVLIRSDFKQKSFKKWIFNNKKVTLIKPLGHTSFCEKFASS